MRAGELESIRDAVASTFHETATRIRPARPTNQVSTTLTTATTSIDYPCRIAASKDPIEQVSGDRTTSTAGYIILLPPTADIRPSDRLRVQDTTYEICGIIFNPTFAACKKAVCLLLQ